MSDEHYAPVLAVPVLNRSRLDLAESQALDAPSVRTFDSAGNVEYRTPPILHVLTSFVT